MSTPSLRSPPKPLYWGQRVFPSSTLRKTVSRKPENFSQRRIGCFLLVGLCLHSQYYGKW
ncbi:hypothetical protein PISMIDRAFT_671017 [Pisolithus microcarpus 441]|uniref:Uncharacterized protein n=1 Tax=Pisolithus microcarpus 441 TaxID=765257 RepID=A0A0D0A924_9AGAM|nr:hypothetical protein PISMIDRAFT_671017 [Pisolithus microcarpus 441]